MRLLYQLLNNLKLHLGIIKFYEAKEEYKMTKKVLCVLLSLLSVMFIFTSCGEKGAGEQIVLPVDKEVEYLDPQIVYETGAKNIVANCFEGLVTFDENGSIVPAACESYKISADGLTYTFNLRTDGRWRVPTLAKETILNYYKDVEGYNYDADFDLRVTADDFIFAFRRALQPETRSPYAQSLMNIKNAEKVNRGKLKSSVLGVKKDGDYTLVITLSKADADFLTTLTLPACMPCNEEFFEITKGHYGLYTNYLIFNGPFYISNWSEKTAITARRNEYYRATEDEIKGGEVSSADIVKPQSVYFSFNNEQETRGRKIKDGTYEIAPLTKEQVEPFLKNEKYTVKSVNSSVTSLILNCADEILCNKKMRQAIAFSLDVQALTEFFGKEKAKGIVPSASVSGNKKYRSEAGALTLKNVSETVLRNLFKEALENLDKRDADFVVLCSEENEKAVRVIMQKWQSVFGASFSVAVNAVDNKTLQQKINSGDYQIALIDVEYSDSTALNALARYVEGSSNNIVNFSSDRFNGLLSDVSNAKNESGRIKALFDAEKYLYESCTVIPVCESEAYYVMGKGVSGIVFNPTGEVAYYKNTISQ